MALITQIGGKYDESNPTLFALKRVLKVDGFQVAHPIADNFFVLPNGRTVAYDPATGKRFLDVEIDYYAGIQQNCCHWVANSQIGARGRVGVSAALEICWAIINRRPIFATDEVWVGKEVTAGLATIIQANQNEIHAIKLEAARPGDLRFLCGSLAAVNTYTVDSSDVDLVKREVDALFTRLSAEPD